MEPLHSWAWAGIAASLILKLILMKWLHLILAERMNTHYLTFNIFDSCLRLITLVLGSTKVEARKMNPSFGILARGFQFSWRRLFLSTLH